MLNLSLVRTPGVYVEEVSLFPPSVAGVETGIPAFVGHTANDALPGGATLVNKPMKISSFKEFETIFGTAKPEGDSLTVKVTDFTDEIQDPADPTKTLEIVLRREINAGIDPGKRSKHNLYYAMQLYFANSGGPCYVVSVGKFGDAGPDAEKLKKGIEAVKNEDEPTMLVVPEAVNTTDHIGIYQSALRQAAELQDRVVIVDVQQTAKESDLTRDSNIRKDFNTAFRGKLGTENLSYAAAYYPYLETTIDYNYFGEEAKIKFVHKKFDPAGNETPGDLQGKTLESQRATNNLLFEQARAALSQVSLELPPSAAVAGIYAQTDASRGVWKAPANVGVSAIVGPSLKIDDKLHGEMNVDPSTGQSVNAIRTIGGRGTVVWGARTLDGNSNEWRYVNVRRFFNFVEESVKKATLRFVFEPNDANTWVKVRAMIENFLTIQWRQGALQGVKPEQAFFVKVGLNQTMTADDVLNGFLIVEIGMAVVRPAEFIILRFSHKLPEA